MINGGLFWCHAAASARALLPTGFDFDDAMLRQPTDGSGSVNAEFGRPVKDGICVDPPPSQGIYGSRIKGLVCKSETVGKTGDEKGEGELVLVVSVRCGKE